jgi:hypothetical protein
MLKRQKAKENLPLCALSLLSMIGCLPIAFPPFSSLTASPRLLVNTFKHTLRGGISSDPSLEYCFGDVQSVEVSVKGVKVFLGKLCMPGLGQSFVKSGVRWERTDAR